MPSPAALRAGRAVIEMGLDSEGVSKGLDKLQGQLRRFGKSLSDIGKQAAIAGGAIVAPFLAGIKTFSTFGDTIAKTSKRLGITTESVSSLAFAADRSGASLETIEKGFRGMARSIFDAQRGSAEITAGFEQLGLTVEELVGLKPDEQFLKIAAAISRIQDPTQKAGIAMKLLGRSGTELLPLFNEGEQGIAALVAEAERLGLVLSSKDAVAAEMLTDAMGDLTSQVKFLFVQLGSLVAGPVTEFARWLSQIAPMIMEWSRQHSTLIRLVALTGTALLALGTASIVLGRAFIALAAAIKIVRTGLTLLAKHPWIVLITVGIIAVGELTGAFDALAKKIDEVIGVADEAKAITDLTKDFKDLTKEIDATGDAVEKLDAIPGIDIAAAFSPAFQGVADVARQSGPSRTESLFDTRLAKQVFGKEGNQIERDQLRELKGIRQAVERSPQVAIPVVP